MTVIDLYFILTFFAIGLCFAISVFVYIQNHESLISLRFIFFSINYALYNFSVVLLFFMPDKESARYVMYFNSITGAWVPVTLSIFLKTAAVQDYKAFKDIWFKLWFGIAIIITLSFLIRVYKTDIFVKTYMFNLINHKDEIVYFAKKSWFYTPKSYLRMAFQVYFVAVLFNSLSVMFSTWRNTKSKSYLKKRYLKELFIFTLACSIVGIGDTLFLTHGTKFALFPMGPVAGIVYVGYIFYALVKYRFLDIDYQEDDLTAFIVAIVLSLFVFIFIYPLISLIPNKIGRWLLIISAITFLLYGLIKFSPKQKKWRTAKKLFEDFEKSSDIDAVKNHLKYLIEKYLESSRVEIILNENFNARESFAKALLSDKHTDSISDKLKPITEVIKYLEIEKNALDLRVIPGMRKDKKQSLIQGLKILDATICMPMVYNEQLTGIIIIGDNEKGTVYSKKDMFYMNAFCSMAVNVLENSRLLTLMQEHIDDFTHELKTPLAAIKMYADYLKKKIKGDKRVEKAIQLILSENDRYTNIISNLLDMTEVENSGDLELNRELVDLNIFITVQDKNKLSHRNSRRIVRIR